MRNKAVYLALGVLPDGTRDVLGIWIEQTEGAKFWLKVFNELQQPRRQRHPHRRRRWPEGLGRGDRTRFPQHDGADLHRASDPQQPGLRELEGSQGGCRSAAPDLHRRHRRGGAAGALEEFERGDWGEKYPTIVQSWRRAWEHVIPFFAFPPEVRKVVYTTNVIESLHMQLRKIIKTRGHFPSDEAATKLIWLALRNITGKGTSRPANGRRR